MTDEEETGGRSDPKLELVPSVPDGYRAAELAQLVGIGDGEAKDLIKEFPHNKQAQLLAAKKCKAQQEVSKAEEDEKQAKKNLELATNALEEAKKSLDAAEAELSYLQRFTQEKMNGQIKKFLAKHVEPSESPAGSGMKPD
jgi:hypothetical protein